MIPRPSEPSEDSGKSPFQPEAGALVTGGGPEDADPGMPDWSLQPVVGAEESMYVGGGGWRLLVLKEKCHCLPPLSCTSNMSLCSNRNGFRPFFGRF